jgi:hypothetical protein
MPDLILESVRTIITLEMACICNPDLGFIVVITATRSFVEFVNRYS